MSQLNTWLQRKQIASQSKEHKQRKHKKNAVVNNSDFTVKHFKESHIQTFTHISLNYGNSKLLS